MLRIIEVLESRGFRYNPEPPERLFVSGPFYYKGRELHIHIHITYFGREEQREKLLFRDYLRRHPEEARRYYELKKLWSKEAADGSEYTELKTRYIMEVLEKARKEEGNKR